jgi:hypothetical protein
MDTSIYSLSPEKRFQLLLDAACAYAIFFMDVNADVFEWRNGEEKIWATTKVRRFP